MSGFVFWGDFRGTRADRVSIDAAGFHRAGAYQISVAIRPTQPKLGKNEITLVLQGKDGRPVTGAKVRAGAQMGAMLAMQALADLQETVPGCYTGSFELPVGGEWPWTVDVGDGVPRAEL
ncbi:MAG: FixH family protein [Candidatus Methylomirabilaceae bacterium]